MSSIKHGMATEKSEKFDFLTLRIGGDRQEAIDALFVYLNTPGADHQQRAGEKIADLILENAIVKNMILHF